MELFELAVKAVVLVVFAGVVSIGVWLLLYIGIKCLLDQDKERNCKCDGKKRNK